MLQLIEILQIGWIWQQQQIGEQLRNYCLFAGVVGNQGFKGSQGDQGPEGQSGPQVSLPAHLCFKDGFAVPADLQMRLAHVASTRNC